MKKVIYSIVFLSALFFIPRPAVSQQKAAYQVPDSYNFDYEVVQQVNSTNKSSSDPKTITYHYSQNGDYSALSASGKNNSLIIYTKDGTMIIVDDQKKTLTVLHMQNMMGDIAKIAEQYKKNNPSATSPSANHDSSDFKYGKTGNTKQISGYTAEEYSYTSSKGEKGSVWYAKVDFNTASFFMMGAKAASSNPAAMNKYGGASSPYPQLTDPHLLLTEAENSSHPGESLTTQSISKKSLVITTKGYTVNDLSNLMGR
jgi:hypothetical protein